MVRRRVERRSGMLAAGHGLQTRLVAADGLRVGV